MILADDPGKKLLEKSKNDSEGILYEKEKIVTPKNTLRFLYFCLYDLKLRQLVPFDMNFNITGRRHIRFSNWAAVKFDKILPF